ncbi:MAG: hypothetical protein D6728_17185, partial [Cyanobacteria bacterium J055]
DETYYNDGSYSEDQYYDSYDSGGSSSGGGSSGYYEEPSYTPPEEPYYDNGGSGGGYSDSYYEEPSYGDYESAPPAAPAEDLKALPPELEAPAPEPAYENIKPELPPKE